MKNLCNKIIIFILVLCMALSVFTGVVYAKGNDTIVILYENDVHCAVEGYSKLAIMILPNIIKVSITAHIP